MKHKTLFFTTLAFFLVVNTSYFWMPVLGLPNLIVVIILLFVFLILGLTLLWECSLAIKEEFSNRQRLIGIVCLFIVLVLAYELPTGAIDFEKFEGKDLLVARQEGTAHCTTTLKLKSNHKFVIRSVCFFVSETRGTYKVNGDTILFNNTRIDNYNDNHYLFAVFNFHDSLQKVIGSSIIMHQNYNDGYGYPLSIEKNELKN